MRGEFWKRGAGEGTRTPDPIITNDVLYQLSYTGTLPFAGPTIALRILLPPLQPFGFAHHSAADPLLSNDALYQLSDTGALL